MAKARIALAASFERNLETMRLFLEQSGAPASVFDDVVKAIVGRLFPLLESLPRAGRDWLLNPPPTDSGKLLQQRVVKKLGSRRELRGGKGTFSFSADAAVASILPTKSESGKVECPLSYPFLYSSSVFDVNCSTILRSAT